MGSKALAKVSGMQPHEISGSESSKIRDNLRRLKVEIESAYLEVSKLLWQVVHDTVGGVPMFEAWGFVSFEDYAVTELGMKRGKAYYLAQIWEELHIKAGIPERKIGQMDWSHAKALAPLARAGGVNDKSVDTWIGRSKTTPVLQFEEDVRAARKAHVSGTSSPVETVHRITIGLYEEQFRNYETAMETAKTIAQSDKTGHLLDLICTEFNAQYVGQRSSRSKALKRYAAMIERGFGVRVIVIDPDSDDVLVGKDMAKELEAAQ